MAARAVALVLVALGADATVDFVDILADLMSSGQNSMSEEHYTDNPVCVQNNCINPVFPGMEDMASLEKDKWFCSNLRETKKELGFCKGAITYDIAVPTPKSKAEESIGALVRKQDRLATSMFFSHMAGMGKDAWDFPRPEESEDSCIQAIYREVCFTYFPRAKPGCELGADTPYMRPCKSSCENYIRECAVQCCDESVKCVFSHEKVVNKTHKVQQKGYSPHDGPSSLCTGSAQRSRAPGLLTAMLLLLVLPFSAADGLVTGLRRSVPGMRTLCILVVFASMCIGANADHTVGNWRMEPDYLMDQMYVPPGKTSKDAVRSSCSVADLAPTAQCSGHGECRTWESSAKTNPTAFCKCYAGWADPECRTERKSQTIAFFLALFLGGVGADRFYLGLTISGPLKLIVLGGLGCFWITEVLIFGSAPVTKIDFQSYVGLLKMFTFFLMGSWYIYDIIRTGSAPVDTPRFRTAADLPHTVYVVVTVGAAVIMGFLFAYLTTLHVVSARKKKAFLMQASEEQEKLALDDSVITGGNAWVKKNKGFAAQTSNYGSLDLPNEKVY